MWCQNYKKHMSWSWNTIYITNIHNYNIKLKYDTDSIGKIDKFNYSICRFINY